MNDIQDHSHQERERQSAEDLSTVLRARREKFEQIKALGIDPFPHEFQRSHLTAEIKNNFEALFEKEVTIGGRIMALRPMGKATFGHLEDASGRLQFYLKQDLIGAENYRLVPLLDLGDIIGVAGKVVKTRTGEITVQADRFKLLAKSLRPLPIAKEKVTGGERMVFDALADKEFRYRQRYADLAVNPQVREVFIKRSRIIASMREYLTGRGYLEVETPILQPLYGGASARPFITHHNALDMTLYLRIANELYLKRLIVGGFEGVFEFAKDFRNEGMDRFHNPEFTMMELYIAYQDYHFMANLVEEMFCKIARDLTGGCRITYQGQDIDLTPPWPRIPMLDAIAKETGYALFGKSLDELRTIAHKLGVAVDASMGEGKIIDAIFGEKVEPKLIQPVFITDYPLALSPLAKRHRSKPGLVERFEPFLAGKEVGNAFTELNDPIDQRERFLEQKRLLEAGDEEAQQLDEDFLRALEYGMPPTTGLGVGIDRLVMIFTDQPSIRDVLLFPQMRPER
ncbi:MAG: lysine--tRNA ligase [candidate division KSB1 bacterium]|nr:lysine--tRNA ligase [candidate division KSB1 bacterium]MDZ7272607.1 lysine--tRNA ligase [candidate division KSB1 bacterium]MDZ7284370.1 lysine--tRNA ligase [candidate division KSB1 bacterium]MDZ7297234.1 lysine--tRNA ligase [candidate division KSB1 bacterium]MDZ7308301.1 lysine--tRNA ligase [candidate division KSB1 bacterium]